MVIVGIFMIAVRKKHNQEDHLDVYIATNDQIEMAKINSGSQQPPISIATNHHSIPKKEHDCVLNESFYESSERVLDATTPSTGVRTLQLSVVECGASPNESPSSLCYCNSSTDA